jgi:hypothetical protein
MLIASKTNPQFQYWRIYTNVINQLSGIFLHCYLSYSVLFISAAFKYVEEDFNFNL